MTTEWQEDWESFVGVLGQLLRRGATPTELANHFGGKVVTWKGILDEKQLGEMAPCVGIELREMQLDLGPAGIVPVGGQSVPAASGAIADWESIPIGSQVTFSATLGDPQSPFSPVELIHLDSGRVIVMIRLNDGVPKASV